MAGVMAGLGALLKNSDAVESQLGPTTQAAPGSTGPQPIASLVSNPDVFKELENYEPGVKAPSQDEDMTHQTDFVSAVWPTAQAAAKQIGVDPAVLVAQSGLETGWGQSLPKNADGSTANNYFGIKADKSWSGPSTSTVTHEENAAGVAHQETDAFRSYKTPAESFADYVAFLKSNPRYAAALENAHDPVAYAQGLQKAGYATDVDYASKITATAASVRRIATEKK